MARSSHTLLDRQIARVRRRLLTQGLVLELTWALAAGLIASIAWILIQPHLLPAASLELRLGVPAVVLLLAALVAFGLALARAPSRLEAALAMDERFHLRERVTTALTLDASAVQSPAGQALLADVQTRVAPLRPADRFPVRLSRSALLVPVLALALVLLAYWYRPVILPVSADGPESLAQAPAMKDEIDRQMRSLLRKPERKKSQAVRSRDLEKMEAELDRLARQPHETREQARQLVKEMTEAEDLIRQREKELAQRADALQAQLKQMARLEKKKPLDGPGKKLEDAMSRGDLARARQEMERLGQQMQAEQEADRLRKKVKDPQLSEEEKREMKEQLEKLQKKEKLDARAKEELQKQIEDVQDRVERLTRGNDAEQRLRDLERQGAISKEELERELDQLKKSSGQTDRATREQLQQLARKLAEAQQAMKEGNDAQAGEKLQEAAQMLKQLDPNGEAGALAQQLENLQQARQGVCQALDGRPTPASGRRPESKDGNTGSREEWARSQMDKGRLQVIDTAPGDGFKGPRKPAEITEEVRQGAQDAPEAIDRQRLPPSAREMTRGFFENLRNEGKAAPNK